MSAPAPHRSRRLPRARHLVRALALTVALTLGSAACSDDDASPDTAAGTDSAAEQASAALEAGLAAHAQGDLTGAAEHYDEVLAHDPTNKYAFYNLALIDEASGNYGLAEEKYRQALETDPAYEPALFNLAILRTGPDPDEAIDLYRRAVEAVDTDAAAWLNLGLLLRAAGREREGNQAVRTAISLNPDLKDPAAAGS